MEVVLKKIHYNPEVFSKIVEDFKAFVKNAQPGIFQKIFLKKITVSDTINMVFERNHAEKMELNLAILKREPEVYLEDFYNIKKILEDAPTEQKVDDGIDDISNYFYVFYKEVIEILWSRNWRRYTTALRDTGKASLL